LTSETIYLFCWYWLADLCAREQIAFILGHALYMKAIHGGKAKNDKIDAGKIARLLRGGALPQAYVYPAGMREIWLAPRSGRCRSPRRECRGASSHRPHPRGAPTRQRAARHRPRP